MHDGPEAVWSIPYVSVAFFPSLKLIFIAYRSSKVSDCIFEIHQLWQSGCILSFIHSTCFPLNYLARSFSFTYWISFFSNLFHHFFFFFFFFFLFSATHFVLHVFVYFIHPVFFFYRIKLSFPIQLGFFAKSFNFFMSSSFSLFFFFSFISTFLFPDTPSISFSFNSSFTFSFNQPILFLLTLSI